MYRMHVKRIGRLLGLLGVSLVPALWAPAPLAAQNAGPDAVLQKIQAAYTKVEMTVNSSRILAMDQAIPKAQVANPELLDFTVLSETQVQLHAKKPGITTVNLWDEKNEVHKIDVVITADVRELDALLRSQFPSVSLKLYPTGTSSVIISGYVDRPDYVKRITDIAQEFYPKIINNMTVGGSQQVLLHVRVMEVSRTTLRTLGFDFANFSSSDFVGQSVSGLVTKANPTTSLFRSGASFTTSGRETFQFGIVNNPSGFVGFLEALKQSNMLKVLAEPDLVTVSGRPAMCLVGGEVPYPTPTGFGNISINFRPFGTQVDFVPIVLGNGGVRLEVRPQVSEIDPTLSVSVAGTSVPGFRKREVDTGVELKFGQTLAIAGLVQQREQTEVKGIPYLMDIPYLGSAFRRNTSTINEVELLVMVRPELVEALDPNEVSGCVPGANSMGPNDTGLYWKGYMEVPTKVPGQMPLHAPWSGPPAGMGPMPEQIPAPALENAPAGAGTRRPSSGITATDQIPDTRVAQRPAISTVPGASGPSYRGYNPAIPQARQSRPRPDPNSPPPGFIGPRGYDVKN